MITMYASVSNRTAEIGTLRALGFQRRNILYSFIAEAMLLGLTGGGIGLFFASFLQLFTISTLNFQTFSELAFHSRSPGDCLEVTVFFPHHGTCRRGTPGLQGSQDEYRGGLEGRLISPCSYKKQLNTEFAENAEESQGVRLKQGTSFW